MTVFFIFSPDGDKRALSFGSGAHSLSAKTFNCMETDVCDDNNTFSRCIRERPTMLLCQRLMVEYMGGLAGGGGIMAGKRRFSRHCTEV